MVCVQFIHFLACLLSFVFVVVFYCFVFSILSILCLTNRQIILQLEASKTYEIFTVLYFDLFLV